MRPLAATAVTAVVVAALAASLPPHAASAVERSEARAVPTTEVRLAALDRGPDVALPHLEGTTVVDGLLRIPVQGATVRLLGRSGTAYVVGVARRNGTNPRIHRVEADGSSALLARPQDIFAVTLSDDGQRFLATEFHGGVTPEVRAWSAVTGDLVARRVFGRFVQVLDADGDRVLLGGAQRGTVLWDTAADSLRRLSTREGVAGDLSADVLATVTVAGSATCSAVTRVSSPEQALWTSCSERVVGFSGNGARMATVDVSNGVDPRRVAVRRISGRAVGRYLVPRGFFGATTFETATSVLLETYGATRSAVVRCVAAACERASGYTRIG